MRQGRDQLFSDGVILVAWNQRPNNPKFWDRGYHKSETRDHFTIYIPSHNPCIKSQPTEMNNAQSVNPVNTNTEGAIESVRVTVN